MKAILCTQYGPPEVLQLKHIEKPVPGANDVLIKICASTVTMGDCELRSLTLPLWTRIPMRLYMGYRRPRKFIPGMELSGIVEAVGKNVVNLKEGDAVFGSGGMGMGGNAEYKRQRAAYGLAIKPAGVSFEDAATIAVGGLNALHFLRKAKIRPGQKVLINGAGGSIGTYGVQLAKHYGAEVTAVDNTKKLDMLREIGADHVIDYTQERFGARGEKYDVIFDMVYGSSLSECMHALNEDGCYLMANPSPARMLKATWMTSRTKKKVVFQFAAENPKDLTQVADMISAGEIKPVIDRRFPLDQIVEAHRYVGAGLKKGNVVINVSQ